MEKIMSEINTQNLIFAAIVIALTVLRHTFELTLNKKNLPRKEHGKGRLTLFVFFISYIATSVSVIISINYTTNIYLYYFIPGTLLYIAANAGRFIALRQIGGSYSQLSAPLEVSRLVSDGAYGIIRHPLYGLYILEFIAFLLLRFNIISLICLIAVIAAVMIRVKTENYELEKKYGEEYLEFKKKVRNLIPGVF